VAVASTILVASLAFAAAGLLLLALSWAVPVPPGWGFRGFPAIFAVVFSSVGAVIATRQRANPIGWMFLASGLLAGVQVAAEEYAFYGLLERHGDIPGGEFAAWLQAWIWLPLVAAVAIGPVLLFPSGRLRSRRWILVIAAAVPTVVLTTLLFALLPGHLSGLAALVDNPYGVNALLGAAQLAALGFAALAAEITTGFVSVVLRFRDAHGVERQQLKWFAYATALVALAIVVSAVDQIVVALTVDRAAVVESAATVTSRMSQLLLIGAMAFLPVSIGVAILRYRLYDIDLLINRTMVYGATSAAIAATFFVGIVALQAVLRPLTAGSELAIAASTLVSFALFQPIRRRVQDAADRRFDRSRYDAARTLDAFADRLRDEVDLDALRGDLLGVVRDTMQPTHSGLWLRDQVGARR